MKLRISGIRHETASIRAFELVDPTGANLPPFTAGAHVDVLTPAGLTRQYSLCNRPDERHRYVIGVLDAPDSRGGSRSLHARVQVGDDLEVSAPRNHFPLDATATSSLLVAGGIGITPLLGMAEHLASVGAPFALHYCVRTATAAAFHGRFLPCHVLSRSRVRGGRSAFCIRRYRSGEVNRAPPAGARRGAGSRSGSRPHR